MQVGASISARTQPVTRAAVAFVDATDRSMDEGWLMDLRRTERLTADTQLPVHAVAWHHGVSAAKRIGWGTAKVLGALIGGPALAVGLTAVSPIAAYAALTGWAGLLAYDTLNVGRVSRLFEAMGEVQSGITALSQKLPTWPGSRTYEIAAGKSQLVDARPHAKEPTASAIKDGLLHNFRTYPGAFHVVVFGGHGLPNCWSSISHRALGQAVAEASQESGQKVGLVLFDSCLQGTLSTLAALAGKADAAVVSEEVVVTRQFPLDRMLRLANREDTPAQAARSVATGAAQAGGATTVAVDLTKMTGALDALDDLGRTLKHEVAAGRGHEIHDALKDATALPYFLPVRGLRSKVKARDLLQFVERLRNDSSPDVQKAAERANAAVSEAIIIRGGWAIQGRNLTGLSFEVSPAPPGPDEPLREWTEAIREIAGLSTPPA